MKRLIPRFPAALRRLRPHLPGRRALAAVCALLAALPLTGRAQVAPAEISAAAKEQIAEVLAVKATFSPAEQKIDSQLVFANRKAHGQSVGAVGDRLTPSDLSPDRSVHVEVQGRISAALRARVAARGGFVGHYSRHLGRMRAAVPLSELEALAADPRVSFIRPPGRAVANVGSTTTQGFVTHQVKQAIAESGFRGAGVKVGVLSDSATPARVAAAIASGDLNPNTVVLDGQAGDPNGSDEGVAMMEIVQDLVPDAQIYFATAFSGEPQFAANIEALAAAGCTIIVDDVSYSDEPAFQDGVVAQAVNAVTAQGALYFSSAANSGSVVHGTSGTWEGDFADGGALTVGGVDKAYRLHSFGTNPYDTVRALGFADFDIHWSDPVGASGNDYDLFVLDNALANVKAFSVNVQNGSQDPFEEVFSPDLGTGGNYQQAAAGDQIVIAKTEAAAARALHLDTERSRLTVGTTGATYGHNAGANTVSLAATFWNSGRTGVRPFDGTHNPAEVFSSDGPRKIFYNPNGSAITPGNLLFGTNGGTTLQKPDLTAADGVVTTLPGNSGLNPFFGTSAAAPHAAAIAALLKSARPNLTNGQILNILQTTALDNEAPGVDVTGGYGVINAKAALEKALTFPAQ